MEVKMKNENVRYVYLDDEKNGVDVLKEVWFLEWLGFEVRVLKNEDERVLNDWMDGDFDVSFWD